MKNRIEGIDLISLSILHYIFHTLFDKILYVLKVVRRGIDIERRQVLKKRPLSKTLTMTNDVYANGHTVRKINFGPGPAQLPVEV
jgi:hypothetical protein